MNGVLNVSSRSPFDVGGLALQVKGGVNDLSLGGASQFGAKGDGMSELTARYAASFNSTVAFKVSGSWLTGTDWKADNYDNIGFGESWETYRDVHGYDGVNVYGDESVSYYPLGVDEDGVSDGSLVGVTRSGYREIDLVIMILKPGRLPDHSILNQRPEVLADATGIRTHSIRMTAAYGWKTLRFTRGRRSSRLNLFFRWLSYPAEFGQFLRCCLHGKSAAGERKK